MRYYLINSPIAPLFHMNTWWAFPVRKPLLPPAGDTDEPAPTIVPMPLWCVNMDSQKQQPRPTTANTYFNTILRIFRQKQPLDLKSIEFTIVILIHCILTEIIKQKK